MSDRTPYEQTSAPPVSAPAQSLSLQTETLDTADAPYLDYSTPIHAKMRPFGARPVDSPFAKSSEPLVSRPFIVPNHANAKLPNVQAQLEHAQKFGYNLVPSFPNQQDTPDSQPKSLATTNTPTIQRQTQPNELTQETRLPLIQREPTETSEKEDGPDAPTKDGGGEHSTLVIGSVGASVKELQTKLNAQGATPLLKVDGIFGPKTHKGVTDFQATHQDIAGKPLKVDGIVGKLTWGALDQASKPKAVPLAADELILSQEPQETNDVGLAQFRVRVENTVGAWRLPFVPSDVQLKLLVLGDAEKQAIVLKWSAPWGAKPVSTSIPASMTPVDARAAVAGVHQLAGWGKLANGDQTILDGMLGGETNMLSQTTRDRLRPQIPTLSTQTDVEQEKVLTGLIAGKDAIPSVVDEPVTTTKIEYTLTGPTEKKNYDFRGKKADAEEWKVAFKDGVTLAIVAPKAPEPGYHNHTVQQAAESASYLPKANRSAVNTILLNAVVNPDDAYWAAEYKDPNFHSYMTAGAAGVVTIYPDKDSKPLPGDNYMRGTMIHETGHTWSYKTWGTDKTKGKWVEWKQAMDKDKVSVSGYAKASIAEDVAETIQIYVSTQGNPRFEEYRQIVPNRFAMLDKEYK